MGNSISSFIKSLLSKIPFIVKSRGNDLLVANLTKDSYPILFEGLHTTLPALEDRLKDKKIYLRAHNIEHRFYKGLEKSESNTFKRSFFKKESKKLKHYEKTTSTLIFGFYISWF